MFKRAGLDVKDPFESYRRKGGRYAIGVPKRGCGLITLFVSRYMLFGEQGVGKPGVVFKNIHFDRRSKP